MMEGMITCKKQVDFFNWDGDIAKVRNWIIKMLKKHYKDSEYEKLLCQKFRNNLIFHVEKLQDGIGSQIDFDINNVRFDYYIIYNSGYNLGLSESFTTCDANYFKYNYRILEN